MLCLPFVSAICAFWAFCIARRWLGIVLGYTLTAGWIMLIVIVYALKLVA